MDISLFLFVGFSCFLLINGNKVEDCGYLTDKTSFQSFQVLLQAEQPYRTAYHFQSPRNWMNGPMQYKGVYHLFYQYNPNSAWFGDGMVWAHSASYDLINWFGLDHALVPSKPFDAISCISGSATILPGDKPVILYTVEWVKYSGNPLMTPPDGVNGDNFRYPTTAWQGPDGTWKVVIGSYSNNQGMAILYKSQDFIHWTMHQDPLYSSSKTEMWVCPDFFPVSINDTNGVDTSIENPSVRHVMKASFNSHDVYIVGTYVNEQERFLPDADFTGTSSDLRFDYGKFYASKSFFDSKKNRRILCAWVNESDSMEDDLKKGWSGLQNHTDPQSQWFMDNPLHKQLVQWPVEELNSLRDNEVYVYGKQLESGSIFEVSGITASQFIDTSLVDPQLICDKQDASVTEKFRPFGLLALATMDLTEQTAIFFRVFRDHKDYKVLMCSDQKRSSLRNELDKTTYGAFVDIDPQREMVSLRTLIDHSIIESFGGKGRSVITTRVYPELAINDEAHLFAFNNGSLSVKVSRLNAWSMNKAQITAGGKTETLSEDFSRKK
ncbi:hypothetical protein E1A91_D13G226100v1 [Gossypium mustelinum]|uniref:Glycosyl hydrolase family 32 N-terminal domain-containing protein n=1 Tax=Gossypium mustelinum TaxID=34275 RepID=A0A5D2S4T2_GOSMU|nr:hypothetical protein E1A91_D13G226100v1 [Gossypium mustelinum]